MPQDLARLLVKRDGDDDGPSVHTLQRVCVPCRCCDLPFLPGILLRFTLSCLPSGDARHRAGVPWRMQP